MPPDVPAEPRPPADDPRGAVVQSEQRFRLLVENVRDYAIFMLDPGGVVLTWNAGAERIKGYRAEEIVGQHFSCFYLPDARAQRYPEHELAEARRTGSYEDEGWRVRKDGSRFWANVVITALHGDDGRLLGFAKVTRDLTQRREHEESLRQSEERFRLLVEGVSDVAIFMLDVNGNVMTWNSGAERIQGYAADEVIGRNVALFYRDEARESGWPQHELRAATEADRFEDEGWRVRRGGGEFWAQVTITAMRDGGGRLIGYALLTRDLSERRRADALEEEGRRREELLDAERSARMAAQQAARVKDEFLATLSHELRTPLSAILGWTQVLRRAGDSFSVADVRRGVDVIDRNARALSQLIDDLLDLSRIMSGKIHLDIEPLAAHDVLRSAVESVEPTARAKDIALDMEFEPVAAPLAADGTRLQQVIWNLLTNAVKFTPRGGRIHVALRALPESVEISVADTGVGIARTFLPLVFDRFAQRDSSASRNYGGLGLGLAISKQLVELHGGTIRAESEGEGHGATFIVELPLADGPRRGEAVPRPDPDVALAPADPVPLPALDGVHVVVVEDESDTRDVIHRALAAQGASVVVCASGEEALAALKGSKTDVVVSDIGMPGMDGYQFMRALRANEPQGERVPALALTAFARAEDRKRSLLAGYQGHLAKPFDLSELVLLVAGMTVNRQAAQAGDGWTPRTPPRRPR